MNAMEQLAFGVLLSVAACGGRTGHADSVGIADCDDYIAKMQACAAHDPRVRATEPALRAQRDAWKQMAKSDRATAEANCKTALASLAAMPGCR